MVEVYRLSQVTPSFLSFFLSLIFSFFLFSLFLSFFLSSFLSFFLSFWSATVDHFKYKMLPVIIKKFKRRRRFGWQAKNKMSFNFSYLSLFLPLFSLSHTLIHTLHLLFARIKSQILKLHLNSCKVKFVLRKSMFPKKTVHLKCKIITVTIVME